MTTTTVTRTTTPRQPDFSDAPEWQRKYLRGDALYERVKAQAALITDAVIDQAQAQAELDSIDYDLELEEYRSFMDDQEWHARGQY